MICIHCKKDSKYKERPGRRCPSCHHGFAFEPREGDPMTDAAFRHAIDLVSAEGKVHWGVEHLYYEVWRRRKPTSRGLAVFLALVALAVVTIATTAQGVPAVVAIVAGFAAAAAVLWLTLRIARRGLDRDRFERLWQRWLEVHGQPQGLIVRPRSAAKPTRVREEDVADYAFDRAVICDRARTVDLLLANHFHFENNCAVLAVGGYPEGVFETVRAMLKRNPRLEVYVLHDATYDGCRLAHRLAHDPQWFPDKVRVVDVGLRPCHAGPFARLLLPAPAMPMATGPGVSGDDLIWLQRHTLELAACRPEQVLKRLYRAINRQLDGTAKGSSERPRVGVDYDSFGSDRTSSGGGDAGTSEGGADGFG